MNCMHYTCEDRAFNFYMMEAYTLDMYSIFKVIAPTRLIYNDYMKLILVSLCSFHEENDKIFLNSHKYFKIKKINKDKFNKYKVLL